MFTSTQKSNGELAIRKLSAKAQEFYNETDPMSVYEVDGLYSVRGCLGDEDGLTLEQLEAHLESMADALAIEE